MGYHDEITSNDCEVCMAEDEGVKYRNDIGERVCNDCAELLREQRKLWPHPGEQSDKHYLAQSAYGWGSAPTVSSAIQKCLSQGRYDDMLIRVYMVPLPHSESEYDITFEDGPQVEGTKIQTRQRYKTHQGLVYEPV